MQSLETKFNSIKTETAKFNACVKKIRDLNESGTSEADIIHKALTLYKTEHGKNKKFFSFMHCWAVVKDLPRFFEPGRTDTSKTLGKIKSSHHEVLSMGHPFASTPLEHNVSNNPDPDNPNPSESTFLERPMGTKQAKKLKADENVRAYTLRRTAQAASSLSSEVDKRNKLLEQQIQCTIDQNALNLFKESKSRNPALEDRWFTLRMEEEIERVEERRALQKIHRQRIEELAKTMPAPTLSAPTLPTPTLPVVRHPPIDLEALPDSEEEEEDEYEDDSYFQER